MLFRNDPGHVLPGIALNDVASADLPVPGDIRIAAGTVAGILENGRGRSRMRPSTVHYECHGRQNAGSVRQESNQAWVGTRNCLRCRSGDYFRAKPSFFLAFETSFCMGLLDFFTLGYF